MLHLCEQYYIVKNRISTVIEKKILFISQKWKDKQIIKICTSTIFCCYSRWSLVVMGKCVQDQFTKGSATLIQNLTNLNPKEHPTEIYGCLFVCVCMCLWVWSLVIFWPFLKLIGKQLSEKGKGSWVNGGNVPMKNNFKNIIQGTFSNSFNGNIENTHIL